MTAAWIAARTDPQAIEPNLRELRTEVDQAWQRARDRVLGVAGPANANDPIHARLTDLDDALVRFDILRRHVGSSNPLSSDLDTWFGGASAVTARAIALAEELMVGAEPPREVVRLNMLITARAARYAEYLGRLRGRVAYHAAARTPMPDAEAAHLRYARNHLDDRLAEVAVAADQFELNHPLSESLIGLREALHGLEEPLQRMLGAADTGDYPLSRAQWWSQTTSLIDQLFAVADASGDQAVTHLRSDARSQLSWLGVYGGLVLVSALFGGFSLVRVRREADQVFVEKETSEIILDSIGDAVIATDAAGYVRYINPVAAQLTSWPQPQASGHHYSDVFRLHNPMHKSENDPIGTCLDQERLVVLTEGHVLVARDGTEMAIEDSCSPIRDPEGQLAGVVVVFTPRDKRADNGGLLSYHATHDALTGVYNRRAFDQCIQQLLEEARYEAREHTVAFADLDNFKVVNDTAGHAAGDQLLRHVAFLMKQHVRRSDMVARLGGDEFAFLLKDCNAHHGEKVMQKIRDEVTALRFPWEERSYRVGMSVGVAAITPETENVESVVREADAACYTAKERGRGGICVAGSADEGSAKRHERAKWATRLTEALDEQRFELYCQPLRPLRPDLPFGMEVLVRLIEQDGTVVTPGAFLPAAERHRIIPDIDRWVIESAFARLSEKLAASDCRININLSGVTLSDPDIGEAIDAFASRFGVTPQRVCFEITETSAVADIEAAVSVMERLQRSGFQFALDDFGSGLSSLTYLKVLPVDMVKIDGTFVRNLPDDAMSVAVVEAIASIARTWGVQTCAEFVESPRVVAELKRIGIDYAQGYLFGKPVPLGQRVCRSNAIEPRQGRAGKMTS